jgi:hypothetical protein
MKCLKNFLLFTAILAVLGFLTDCDRQVRFNDTLVALDDEIVHQIELLFGKGLTFKLDQTPAERLETLKKLIPEFIKKAERISSDGSEEAENFRSAFLDLFDYYQSSTDGVLQQIVELMSRPRGDETSENQKMIDELIREFYDGTGEFYDTIEETQKVYAKKIGARIMERRKVY